MEQSPDYQQFRCFKLILGELFLKEEIQPDIFVPINLYRDKRPQGQHFIVSTNYRIFFIHKSFTITHSQLLSVLNKPIVRNAKGSSSNPNPNQDRNKYYDFSNIPYQVSIKLDDDTVFTEIFKNVSSSSEQSNSKQANSDQRLEQSQKDMLPYYEQVQRDLLSQNLLLCDQFKKMILCTPPIITAKQFWANCEQFREYARIFQSIEQQHLRRNIELVQQDAVPVFNRLQTVDVPFAADIILNFDISADKYLMNRPPKKQETQNVKTRVQLLENMREMARINDELHKNFIQAFALVLKDPSQMSERKFPRLLPENKILEKAPPATPRENKRNTQRMGMQTESQCRRGYIRNHQWENDRHGVLNVIRSSEINKPIWSIQLVQGSEQREVPINAQDEEFKRVKEKTAEIIKKLQWLYQSLERNQPSEHLREHLSGEAKEIRQQIMKSNDKQKSVIGQKEDLQKIIEKALNYFQKI